jgi:hypothetical protein
MKFPFKTIISGKEYKVKFDPNFDGGEVDADIGHILIGKPVTEILDTLLHEVLEAILIERRHRYQIYGDEGNEQFLFNFDHKEYVNICKDLSLALRPVLKKG